MLGNPLPLRVTDLAGAGGQITAQELAEVALANETDAGRILLGMRREASFLGDAAQRALSSSPIGNSVAASWLWPNWCRK